jgi:CubicO group peptidase (beta-lactamase class C family)
VGLLRDLLVQVDLEELLVRHDVTGCSIAVTDAGETTAITVGRMSADRGDPVTEQTIFQACSLSKPVSVLACMQLVAEARVPLDDDVDPLLNEWNLPRSGSWRPRVTVRQLASHTAATTVSGFEGYAVGAAVPTTVELLSGAPPSRSAAVRVAGLPGLRFRYSGGGTTILQHIIESVTGEPAERFLNDVVARSWGMERSGFLQPLPRGRVAEAASGHDMSGTRLEGGWRVYPELCAAGLWTTPLDLARFLGMFQVRLRESGPSADLARSMLIPHAAVPVAAAGPGGFHAVGMGFFLRTVDGVATWFGHDGSNAGYRCHMIASAFDDRSLVVMTNGDGGSEVIAEILERVSPALSEQWDDAGEAPPLWTGSRVFETGRGVALTLSVDGATAVLTLAGQEPLRLEHRSRREYGERGLGVKVRILGDGAIAIHQDESSIVCRRVT